MDMQYFYEFYETLDRLGPGSKETTLNALRRLPEIGDDPKVLDIGCGCGAQALVLAEQLPGTVVAVDNHQHFLDRLQARIEGQDIRGRVKPQLASMFELPFSDGSFDLIWSEGAIYVIGFSEGLRSWRPLLRPAGVLAVTEAVWMAPDPPEEIVKYWRANYPAIQGVDANRKLIDAGGYRLLDDFPVPASDWLDYYRPQEQRVAELRGKYPDQPEALAVCAEIEREIEMYRNYGDSFGYQFFLMEKA